MDIQIIKREVREKDFQYTLHALEKLIERDISEDEISEAILNDEIIEEYPTDEPFPSCLIYGKTNGGKNIHVVCSTAPEIWIITVYEPDPNEWIDFKKRKR